MGNGILNIVLKFFPHWMKAKKLVLGAHSPHISGSIGSIVSKNNRVHSWWTRTDHVISWKSVQNCNLYRTFLCIFVIRNLQKEKRDHPHLLHPTPSEVDRVRIVVILFQNMAKEKGNSFYTIYSDMIIEYSVSGMILKLSIELYIDISFKKHRYYRYQISWKNNTTKWNVKKNHVSI